MSDPFLTIADKIESVRAKLREARGNYLDDNSSHARTLTDLLHAVEALTDVVESLALIARFK